MKDIARLIVQFLPLLLIVLSSCSEQSLVKDGEGTLMLKVGMQSDLPLVSTRSTLTDEELLQHCKIYIRNSQGLVRKYTSLEEMPEHVLLVADKYKAEVVAGDSVAASFEDSYYKGASEFVLVSGQTLSQTITCKIQNLVTAIDIDEDLLEAVPDYTITISTRRAKLIYTPENINQLGYFMLLNDENQLTWTFDGKTIDGTPIAKNGTITRVRKSTKYMLTFSNSSAEVGGAMIKVSVVEKNLDTPDDKLEVELNARPIIKRSEDSKNWVDIDGPIYCALNGYSIPIVVGFAANTSLTSVQMRSADFQRLDSRFPISSAGYDFIAMDDKERDNLRSIGLAFTLLDDNRAIITFEENLRRKMTETVVDGPNTYQFEIQVTDANGGTRQQTLIVITTDISVVTEKNKTGDAWAKKAMLRGRILDRSKATEIWFKYRKKNGAWNETPKMTLGSTDEFSYMVKGLDPGTPYEYQAVGDGIASPIIFSFITEDELQLPNNSFEEWTDGTPMLIYNSNTPMYWDSGNHGSETAGENVTVYETEPTKVHSGSKSIKLMSKSVGLMGVTQFAAGNVFAGKYVSTQMDGVRGNGILGWGRPFVSRPAALRAYVRYVSGIVDCGVEGRIKNGEPDKGIIYVAVGDWNGETSGGQVWSKIIKTDYKNPSNAKLFNPADAAIIGYGEKVFDASTSGTGLVEITIPIDYRSEGRSPSSIILVASSSKFGDYFAGSTGSTLWLDDLELIYE